MGFVWNYSYHQHHEGICLGRIHPHYCCSPRCGFHSFHQLWWSEPRSAPRPSCPPRCPCCPSRCPSCPPCPSSPRCPCCPSLWTPRPSLWTSRIRLWSTKAQLFSSRCC